MKKNNIEIFENVIKMQEKINNLMYMEDYIFLVKFFVYRVRICN